MKGCVGIVLENVGSCVHFEGTYAFGKMWHYRLHTHLTVPLISEALEVMHMARFRALQEGHSVGSKTLQRSETELRELLGGTKENHVSPNDF